MLQLEHNEVKNPIWYVVSKSVDNFANMTKNLNLGLPRTIPASCKGSWT